MILAQECFITQLNLDSSKLLAKRALYDYNQKIKLNEWGWLYGMNVSAFIMVRVMYFSDYEPFIKVIDQYPSIKIFIESSAIPNTHDKFFDMLNTIKLYSESFLK